MEQEELAAIEKLQKTRREEFAECQANGYTTGQLENVPLRPYLARYAAMACLSCWIVMATTCIAVYLASLITGGFDKPLSPDSVKSNPSSLGPFFVQIIGLLFGFFGGFTLAEVVLNPLTPKDFAVLQRRRTGSIVGGGGLLSVILGAISSIFLCIKIGNVTGLNHYHWPFAMLVCAWTLMAGVPMAVYSIIGMAMMDRHRKKDLVAGLEWCLREIEDRRDNKPSQDTNNEGKPQLG